jgi:hypothetical protein
VVCKTAFIPQNPTRAAAGSALYFLKRENLAIFSLLSSLATSCYHLLLHAELNLVIFMKNRPFLKSVEFSASIHFQIRYQLDVGVRQ